MTKNSFLTVTDQFCGAGGSSIGATSAGLELKLALNHWARAVETHNANFPNARHECTDISACEPRRYPSTDILITSPECTNHSVAKGQSRRKQWQPDLFDTEKPDPSEERSRATMWDVPRFAEFHSYNLIIVENVVDARQWVMWDAWLHAMDLLGYSHKCVYFNSMHAWPTPQSRDRMYVVFWKKGNKAPNLDFRPLAHCPSCGKNIDSVQVWKNPSRPFGRYRQQYVYMCPCCQAIVEPYYYCAANAVDWSLPAPRIGDRAKPLQEKTLRRIRIGLEKFAKQLDHPMIVELAYAHAQANRSHLAIEPLPTQTSRQTQALAIPPFLLSLNHSTERLRSVSAESFDTVMPQTIPALAIPFIAELRNNSHVRGVTEALSTLCAGGGHHGLVMPPMLMANYSPGWVKPVTEPTGSITTVDHHSLLVPPFLTSYYGTATANRIEGPVPTVTTRDRHALVVPPFILSYYTRISGLQAAVSGMEEALPTQPTWPLHYLVEPGKQIEPEDCGFRMLQPHEIQNAMAFPVSYVVTGNGREKVRQLGNAVTPPVMRMLIERCVQSFL